MPKSGFDPSKYSRSMKGTSTNALEVDLEHGCKDLLTSLTRRARLPFWRDIGVKFGIAWINSHL